MKKNESQKCRAKIIQGREMKETNVKKGEDLWGKWRKRWRRWVWKLRGTKWIMHGFLPALSHQHFLRSLFVISSTEHKSLLGAAVMGFAHSTTPSFVIIPSFCHIHSSSHSSFFLITLRMIDNMSEKKEWALYSIQCCVFCYQKNMMKVNKKMS